MDTSIIGAGKSMTGWHTVGVSRNSQSFKATSTISKQQLRRSLNENT